MDGELLAWRHSTLRNHIWVEGNKPSLLERLENIVLRERCPVRSGIYLEEIFYPHRLLVHVLPVNSHIIVCGL